MYARRRSKQQWRELIEEFEGSGLSQQEYTQQKEIRLGTFRSWFYTLRKGDDKPRFIEVVATAATKVVQPPIVTVAIGDAHIDFGAYPSADYLAQLLRNLGGTTT